MMMMQYDVLRGVQPLHAGDVAGQVVLACDLAGAREVVDFLRVQMA